MTDQPKVKTISFVYMDNRLPVTRTVTAGPAHVHRYLERGHARIADEESQEGYEAWCDANDVEPVEAPPEPEPEPSHAVGSLELTKPLAKHTLAELEDLGDALDLQFKDLDGTGAGGKVVKQDWLDAIQARMDTEATEPEVDAEDSD